MNVVLLGGGSGGHFYPLIAVADALRNIADAERIVSMNITFIGDTPFDEDALRQYEIQFEHISSGKYRRYFSLLNIVDIFKTIIGIFQAMWRFTLLPPDVIFSKGGHDAFPALFAARIYRIPVVIHETDSVPGVVNAWAAKFAKRVAVSFPEAAKYFPEEKVALTGQPIRKSILGGSREEAYDMFGLEEEIPIIFVLGGSQGSQKINDVFLAAAPELVEKVQVVHVTGKKLFSEVSGEITVALEKSEYKKRYHVYPYLNSSQIRNASFAANIVVCRPGGTIFEVAVWQVPAILIPILKSPQSHQRENAYNYARTGAAIVVEESNLTPHLLIAEINKLIDDKEEQQKMQAAAQSFARIDAAEKIAQEVIALGIHE